MAKPTGFGGRDYPDFGASITAGRTAQIFDMSELAVRLGGLSWFDRVGNVLMQEGFENGLSAWEVAGYPAGAFPVPDARFFSTVPYAAKLVTTTDSGSYSAIQRAFPFPYVANFGVELHFKSVVAFKEVYWTLDFYTGTHRYYLGVKVDYADSELQLYTDKPGYEKIDDLNIRLGGNSPFHVLKVTYNLALEKHIRLILDYENYDVSSFGVRKTSTVTVPWLTMQVLLMPVALTKNEVWVDNIIFTIDEPGV